MALAVSTLRTQPVSSIWQLPSHRAVVPLTVSLLVGASVMTAFSLQHMAQSLTLGLDSQGAGPGRQSYADSYTWHRAFMILSAVTLLWQRVRPLWQLAADRAVHQ